MRIDRLAGGSDAAEREGDLAERLRLAEDEIALLKDYVELLQAEISAADAAPRLPSGTDAAATQRLQHQRDELRKASAAEAARLERQREALMRSIQIGLHEREALRAARTTIGRLTGEIAALMDQAIRGAAEGDVELPLPAGARRR